MWTPTIDAKGYSDFLWSLLQQLADGVLSDGRGRAHDSGSVGGGNGSGSAGGGDDAAGGSDASNSGVDIVTDGSLDGGLHGAELRSLSDVHFDSDGSIPKALATIKRQDGLPPLYDGEDDEESARRKRTANAQKRRDAATTIQKMNRAKKAKQVKEKRMQAVLAVQANRRGQLDRREASEDPGICAFILARGAAQKWTSNLDVLKKNRRNVKLGFGSSTSRENAFQPRSEGGADVAYVPAPSAFGARAGPTTFGAPSDRRPRSGAPAPAPAAAAPFHAHTQHSRGGNERLAFGSTTERVTTIRVTMSASGTVEDYTAPVRSSIASSFATAAGVAPSDVTVAVSRRSAHAHKGRSSVDKTVSADETVSISIGITSYSQEAAEITQGRLASRLATPEATTHYLMPPGVTVTSSPVIAVSKAADKLESYDVIVGEDATIGDFHTPSNRARSAGTSRLGSGGQESSNRQGSSRPSNSSWLLRRPISGDSRSLAHIKFDKRDSRQQARPATASTASPAERARLSVARPSTADASLRSRRYVDVIKMRELTMDSSAPDASTPDAISAIHNLSPASWPRATMSRAKSLETLSGLSRLSMPVSPHHQVLFSASSGNWELKPAAKQVPRRRLRPYYVEANTRGSPPDKLAWSLPLVASAADAKAVGAHARASELFSLQGYRFVPDPVKAGYSSAVISANRTTRKLQRYAHY